MGATWFTIPLKITNVDPNDDYPTCSPGCLDGSGNLEVGKVYRKSDGTCYATTQPSIPSTALDNNEQTVIRFSTCPKFCTSGMGFAAAGSLQYERHDIDDITAAG